MLQMCINSSHNSGYFDTFENGNINLNKHLHAHITMQYIKNATYANEIQ